MSPSLICHTNRFHLIKCNADVEIASKYVSVSQLLYYYQHINFIIHNNASLSLSLSYHFHFAFLAPVFYLIVHNNTWWFISGCSPGATVSCIDPNGFYAHPSDCQKYYQCAAGTAYEYTCAAGTLWSTTINACDWEANVQCNSGNQLVSFQ